MDIDDQRRREGFDEAQYWERQLFGVQDALNRYNLMSSRAHDAGPVMQLVHIIAQCVRDSPNAFVDLVTLAMQKDGFQGISDQTVAYFASLQISYPWLKEEMKIVFGELDSQLGPMVFGNKAIAETFHRLYNLNKFEIYLEIVKTFVRHEPLEVEAQVTLVDYAQWCLTEDVVLPLLDPSNEYTRRFLDVWSNASRNIQKSILPSIVFRTTMALIPINVTSKFGSSEEFHGRSSKSMAQILGDPSVGWALAQRHVAHILYPNIFTPSKRPVATADIAVAVSIAIKADASLEQVEQICPYSPSPQMAFLMADISRIALKSDRIGIAVAYGFGPNMLQLIDMDQSVPSKNGPRYPKTWQKSQFKSWQINDFLHDIHPDIEPQTVLEMMQVSQDQIDMIVENFYTSF